MLIVEVFVLLGTLAAYEGLLKPGVVFITQRTLMHYFGNTIQQIITLYDLTLLGGDTINTLNQNIPAVLDNLGVPNVLRKSLVEVAKKQFDPEIIIRKIDNLYK
jgi:hypothetical protein